MIKLKLEELLEEKDKSIYWLAQSTDLTYPAVRKMVQGNTKGIQFDSLEQVMEALEIDRFDDILKKVSE